MAQPSNHESRIEKIDADLHKLKQEMDVKQAKYESLLVVLDQQKAQIAKLEKTAKKNQQDMEANIEKLKKEGSEAIMKLADRTASLGQAVEDTKKIAKEAENVEEKLKKSRKRSQRSEGLYLHNLKKKKNGWKWMGLKDDHFFETKKKGGSFEVV